MQSKIHIQFAEESATFFRDKNRVPGDLFRKPETSYFVFVPSHSLLSVTSLSLLRSCSSKEISVSF
jgi:hypothetical protein